MKFLPFYKDTLHCEESEQVFQYLLKTLKPSNMLWSYFVNWDKVLSNTKKIEVSLNLLNYLIGKDNFDDEFRALMYEYPILIQTLPHLVVRDGEERKQFKILVDYKNKRLKYENYDFSKSHPTEEDIEKYLHFVTKTGFRELVTTQRITNLVDYVIGVEAGLDSNGRKNRGGHAMEGIVEVFIQDLCEKMGYRYLKEANAKKIKQELGYDVPVDKASRRYDYVVDTGQRVILIETNFYGGRGSKLKSTAGEYKDLFDVLGNGYQFIWITDGMGWKGTSRPLREAFDHIDYVVNLKMLEDGVLSSAISS